VRAFTVLGFGALALAAEAAACGGDDLTTNPIDAGKAETSIDDATVDAASAVSSVPQTGTIGAPSLSGPVDLVRDEWGNPHIYGQAIADVMYVQGYVTAQDRIIQLEFERHFAAGRIAELAGVLGGAGAVQTDIGMRMHHMEADAQTEWDTLQAATDDESKAAAKAVTAYAAGVNAYVADLVAGKYQPPGGTLALIYKPSAAKPWTPVDSLMLGQLEAYDLAYDSDSEITSSLVDAQVAAVYGSDLLRQNLNKDLQLLSPLDPTTTISGWTGSDGTRASGPGVHGAGAPEGLIDLLRADQRVVESMGDDHKLFPERGSNNWIIGPSLSKTGNVLVANDTHLGLTNPSTFYLVHLHADESAFPMNVMGVSFPGIPGVILGMTQHTAWGATVSNIDVTDVYSDDIVACDGSDAGADGGISGAPCTMYKGSPVPLVARNEDIGVGSGGDITKTYHMTYYEDPNHGPLIPRPNATSDGLDPLRSKELAVSYTGYKPSQLVRFVFGLDRASSMNDALAALDQDFEYGGQNWVIGDDQGNFGWSQYVRVPRRASALLAPWKVLPGDGTDDWVGTLDPKYIPHAYNPTAGFLATANADPIGVTLSNDPFFLQPTGPDGLPLYLGWQYDSGTRVGRITKRIQAATQGGAKIGLDDIQSIQADATTEWGQALAPTLVDAMTKLAAEIATPGTYSDLTALAAAATAQEKTLLAAMTPIESGWTFDTPSGVAETSPTPAQIADSQATLMYDEWYSYFAQDALGDELTALGVSIGTEFQEKLLARACTQPNTLAEGTSTTSDPI
ncbi:MAG: penicillin acylase family protein, partial [Polyangiaceae bacterium]